VVLTLPMAGLIKQHYPKCKVYFLGRSYTKDIIALSQFVDVFVNYDDLEKLPQAEQIKQIESLKADVIVHVFPVKQIAQLAKAAGIAQRVGTTNRLYHWFSCNRLIRLSRKNSDLHESQLNMKLLSFLNIDTIVTLSKMPDYYGFTKIPVLHEEYRQWIDASKVNVILHPKSKGSAKEWGLENFSKLIRLLPKERYKLFISGTAQDGAQMQEFLKQNPDAMNITGQLSLQQFIAFISHCDALIAASTGPLHIAAALNKKVVGLFSPRRPIHPGRWMPIGRHAHYLVADAQCEACAKKQECNCILNIEPQQVVHLLEENYEQL